MDKPNKPKYKVDDSMKTVVGASDIFYHTKRKGSRGKILKVGNAGGICYLIEFSDHEEWYYENELLKIK